MPEAEYRRSATDSSASDRIGCCHHEHYGKLFPSGCGVDVFAANHDGETALHLIAERSQRAGLGHDKALFEATMAKGLDPLQEDNLGRSALDVASACEKIYIVAVSMGKRS
ncbi:hypothetical protein B0H63DRAFT_472681 [Podospora didyma]|uniref:Ankyrin repeat protein n=1 Tax=Podospora didyma TaxID=330526 RepID=A0AAE0TZK0_9PEZI|nr:hypothetical protein B0H63DRAFT_472681 [Podospora didyma]